MTSAAVSKTRSVSWLVAALLSAFALAWESAVAKDPAAEIAVKAAIVHKIAKFVSWPNSGTSGNRHLLRFCILGDSNILRAFENLSGRSIHGRPVRVLPAPEPSSVVASCDVLYLDGNQRRSADIWIDSVSGHPVLTFGEAGQPGGKGSIVTIMVRRNKVRFAIDLDANKNTGLRISAQLLQLAASVGGSGS